MTKEFVPYELALKLKQLGFDEPCISYYTVYGKFSNDYSAPRKYNSEFELGSYISAPTLSQAFRWFRENYSLYSLIGMHPNTKEWYSSYQNLNWSGKETLDFIKTEDRRIRFKTYEEAELATLDKLIEIVETKQQEQ
jgi:hypothetical protein